MLDSAARNKGLDLSKNLLSSGKRKATSEAPEQPKPKAIRLHGDELDKHRLQSNLLPAVKNRAKLSTSGSNPYGRSKDKKLPAEVMSRLWDVDKRKSKSYPLVLLHRREYLADIHQLQELTYGYKSKAVFVGLAHGYVREMLGEQINWSAFKACVEKEQLRRRGGLADPKECAVTLVKHSAKKKPVEREAVEEGDSEMDDEDGSEEEAEEPAEEGSEESERFEQLEGSHETNSDDAADDGPGEAADVAGHVAADVVIGVEQDTKNKLPPKCLGGSKSLKTSIVSGGNLSGIV